MKFTRIFALMALAGIAGGAQATDGYYSHSYGMKSKGMGGVATATASDAMGGANNPASMAFVGDRIDLGVDLFSPRRSASRTGAGLLDGSVDSDRKYFLIPEFGYNRMINPNLALGVTVYGNGGMNTTYKGTQINCGFGPANMLCGPGKLGVDLMQLIVAPTAAYQVAPGHALGISPLIGYERFKAYGLQAFSPASSDPANLTDRGYDDAFGYGVRIGYQGKITPTVTLGAAYTSKVNFDKLSKYKGLFAEQGNFDMPSNYGLGVAWQANPQLMLALDYERINYTDGKAVSNPSTNAFIPAPLGASNGPGFGWDDIDVWKLGVEYKYSPALTLRAGYNHTDNPIQARDVTFNILAPGVIKDHVTLGLTYAMPSGNELTVAYMHAFKNDVTGTSILPAFGGGMPAGTEKIEMYQNSLGVTYSWKL